MGGGGDIEQVGRDRVRASHAPASTCQVPDAGGKTRLRQVVQQGASWSEQGKALNGNVAELMGKANKAVVSQHLAWKGTSQAVCPD